MIEAEERAAAVAEAVSWLRTPYHPMGRIKGVGADCLTFLAGVFETAGLVPPIDVPYYPADWHMHRGEERYMNGLLDYCIELHGDAAGSPLPADIVLWRVGRCFSHGAIVEAWPRIIQSFQRSGVMRSDAERDKRLAVIGENGPEKGKPRPRRIFRLKRWAGAAEGA
jgi:cell wall-associated NlpC family hydrolase